MADIAPSVAVMDEHEAADIFTVHADEPAPDAFEGGSVQSPHAGAHITFIGAAAEEGEGLPERLITGGPPVDFAGIEGFGVFGKGL